MLAHRENPRGDEKVDFEIPGGLLVHWYALCFTVSPKRLRDDLVETVEVLQGLWEERGAQLQLANLSNGGTRSESSELAPLGLMWHLQSSHDDHSH